LTGVATVSAVTRLMTGERSPALALAGAIRLLTEGLAADGCLLYQVEDNDELVVTAIHPPHPGGGPLLRLRGGFGVIGRVAADQIPAVLVDDTPRNRVHRELLGLDAAQRVSRLCVPARSAQGRCRVVLAVHNRTRRQFDPAEVELAQQVADLVGLRMELDRAATSLATYEREWEGLVAVTVAAQEAERRRVAGDLHDGVTQAIASLIFHLSAVDVALAESDLEYAAAQVQVARSVADLAFAETRSAISGLHSPVLDDLGLAAGLASMARNLPNLDVQVDAEDLDLPDHIESALFRVAQEALQNVVKHAQAGRAGIHLARHGRSVVLRVTDDGLGFPAPGHLSSVPQGRAESPRYGLSGMYERVHLIGGQLSVSSTPGDGCVVEVVVPDLLD